MHSRPLSFSFRPRKTWPRLLWALLALIVLAAAALVWHWRAKLPQRSGTLQLAGLQAPVQVRWDEAGVPHLRADNENDLYRALGYLHAQDRLFQMEIMRRLARGELAEVLGEKLLDTDRLFRTLGLGAHAEAHAAREFAQIDKPSERALLAYLDGVNQYQASRPAPLEFELLGLPKRPFTPADTLAVAGYLAYSFAAAFRTEPVLTQIRDQLGPDYLRAFELDWQTEGVVGPRRALSAGDWQDLQRLAGLAAEALADAGVPAFEGSNAWAIAGSRTASGKPLLAGDPHIAFAAPAVWWEAHLQAPGFELYGHFQALNPMALLGHNQRFGWSLTMFQNDDIDLIAETPKPDDPGQVMHQGRWVALQSREERIAVKGRAQAEILQVQRSPHGPIVNRALGGALQGGTPIALWWALLETENPLLEAFYQLNRADSLAKARGAARLIHAPGLNIVWASAGGDIGWWAAARLPLRPAGVNPSFILDGAAGEGVKSGFAPFEQNPQQENPASGYLMSANHQPAAATPVPGYYNLWDRAERLDAQLRAPERRWDLAQAQALQLDVRSGYGPRLLAPLLPELRAAAGGDAAQRALVEELAGWDGSHGLDSRPATLFRQLLWELARAALADELGEAGFAALCRTRALDAALPRLAADAASPWWDRRGTPAREGRREIVAAAWAASLAHLRATLGADSAQWRWGRANSLTHEHPLGRQPPLQHLFDIGPLPVAGAHELPNNMAARLGPAPWKVVYGPSTRRVVDFGAPGQAQGSNPVGQSGVWGDRHARDQAEAHAQGRYRAQHLEEQDVASHTRSTLVLKP